jgi:hypothetical protein
MSHSRIGCREKVDSRLLIVGSQTASLTTGPSFAHNLGCRCPNDSCEGILDIYTSRTFHWYKEHSNEMRFDPCNRALSFQESLRTPFFPFSGVWASPSHLAQSGVVTTRQNRAYSCLIKNYIFVVFGQQNRPFKIQDFDWSAWWDDLQHRTIDESGRVSA